MTKRKTSRPPKGRGDAEKRIIWTAEQMLKEGLIALDPLVRTVAQQEEGDDYNYVARYIRNNVVALNKTLLDRAKAGGTGLVALFQYREKDGVRLPQYGLEGMQVSRTAPSPYEGFIKQLESKAADARPSLEA